MTPIERLPVHTIGHSTRSIAEFVELLNTGRVEMVVDIRSTRNDLERRRPHRSWRQLKTDSLV